MTRTPIRALAIGLALTFLVSARPADAGTPFDGKVITSDKRIPTSANSKRAYFTKLRKGQKTKFQEDKEKKQWKIYYAAFFKKPLNDLQITIKLYDVTERERRLLMTMDQYLDQRGQSNVLSHFTLDRDKVGVNRKVLMVVERARPYRGTLAQGTFQVLGKAEKFSGKVEFTEEEANGKD